MEKKLVPALIDNKHILEEWDWIADGGDYVWDQHKNNVFLMFFDNHVPWLMDYMFGGNVIRVRQISPAFNADSFESVKNKLLATNESTDCTNVFVELKFPGDGSIIASYWAKNE